MNRAAAALLLLVPLLSACTAGPATTSVGVSTGATVGGTHTRVGATTAGRGVHLGVGLGRTIR